LSGRLYVPVITVRQTGSLHWWHGLFQRGRFIATRQQDTNPEKDAQNFTEFHYHYFFPLHI